MMHLSETKWEKSNAQVFWGEIATNDHIVQIYDNEEVIMDSIEGFVTSGFVSGDCVVIIATRSHLNALNTRLRSNGFNTDVLISNGLYIPLDADATLSKFMVDGKPDKVKFENVVAEVFRKARGKNNRRVRAYGEMVALLWNDGNKTATIDLENLWNQFAHNETFCLFCAYPRNIFNEDGIDAINDICSTHTKVIAGDVRSKSLTDVFFK